MWKEGLFLNWWTASLCHQTLYSVWPSHKLVKIRCGCILLKRWHCYVAFFTICDSYILASMVGNYIEHHIQLDRDTYRGWIGFGARSGAAMLFFHNFRDSLSRNLWDEISLNLIGRMLCWFNLAIFDQQKALQCSFIAMNIWVSIG